VLRGLWHALKLEDPFCRFATAGLMLLFGLQSTINVMVNLHMIPAKGMTLPFVSYGGSSLIAVAYSMGMVLALTRRRPRADVIARTWSQTEREGGLRPDAA
jgi:cell division protein FtsW